jgi:hypothetical protein
MKQTFTILTILCLTFGMAMAQSNYRVVENGFDKVVVHYTAGTVSATDVTTDAGAFSRVTMDEYYLSTEVGKPQLPVMVNLLEIPLCEGVSYSVRSSRYSDFTAAELGIHHPLFPAQPSYTKSHTGPVEFVKDAEAYRTNAFYHRDLVTVEKSGILRNINVATVYFSPVQYNPVTNTYRIYEDVTVEFTFENADIPGTYQMKNLHGNAVFNGLQSRVINPIHTDSRESTFSRPIKYLIVAHSMFRDQLNEFIAWKKRQGLDVEIAYTDESEVGTTTTTIANFIKAKYTNATEDDPAPTYVLLVGDIAQIPVFNTRVSGEDHKTDLYYFTWTPGDNFPDCYYGRFSAQNVGQLNNILDKVLQYEQYTMPDPTYLDDAVLVAGSDPTYGPTHANGQISYLSNNYVNDAYGYSNVHLYLYNSSSQAAQIRSDIGAGVGYANYTAHCDETGWSDPEFNTSQIASMHNEDRYCFMIGNCCLSNKFDENECFGEAQLRTSKKGAVSYIGGTNYTYWDEDFYWAVGVRSSINTSATYDAAHLGAYDRLFHTNGETFSDWYVTGGSMIQGGNLSVESSSSSLKLYYWEIYHLMGDPSILPWLTQAEVMAPSVPDAMVSGATTLQVTAVPFAYVALTENGEVIAAATADENGAANLTFNPVLAGNDYEVAITAQNYQPYFMTVIIIVPEGPYVVTTDIHPTEGQLADYGVDLTLDATLRNLGVEGANNVTSTIATESDQVTLTNNTISTSALASDAEQVFTSGFAFHIADDIVDRTVVPFTITTTYNGNQTTTTNYSLRLNAPVLANVNVYSTEAEGDNNGAINPGETATLRITTRNSGHATATGITSHLSTACTGVTIVEADLNLGNIPAGENVVSEFTLQISENTEDPLIIPFIHNISAGAYSFTDTVYVFVGQCVEDFETGNFTKFPWSTTGSYAWQVSTSNVFEGNYCAVSKSGMSNYGSSSVLTIPIHTIQDDTVSFYRRFSEGSIYYGSNEFRFYIDDNVVESISSNTSWGRAAFPISAGEHTLKFEYYCGAYFGTSGVAAIDYVKFPMNDRIGLSIEENGIGKLVVYPNPASEKVTVALPDSKSGYTLALFDLNGNRVLSRNITGGEAEYTLDVKALASGAYILTLFNDSQVYTGKVVKR